MKKDLKEQSDFDNNCGSCTHFKIWKSVESTNKKTARKIPFVIKSCDRYGSHEEIFEKDKSLHIIMQCSTHKRTGKCEGFDENKDRSLTYETLPQKLKDKLFKAHEHGDTVDEEDIVYKEADVIDIINYCLNL